MNRLTAFDREYQFWQELGTEDATAKRPLDDAFKNSWALINEPDEYVLDMTTALEAYTKGYDAGRAALAEPDAPSVDTGERWWVADEPVRVVDRYTHDVINGPFLAKQEAVEERDRIERMRTPMDVWTVKDGHIPAPSAPEAKAVDAAHDAIVREIEARHREIADRKNWRWDDNNMAHARMLMCDMEAFGTLHEFPVILIDADGDGLSIVPDNGDTDIDDFIAHAPADIDYLLNALHTVTAERDALRPLHTALAAVRIDELSPIEAMTKLYELKRMVQK